MYQMPIVNLEERCAELAAAGKRVSVLWQTADTLAFVARGREYRSEFHINPADEMMYMIRGVMHLHYRNDEGKEEVAVIPQGGIIHTPTGIAHSPRFPPDAFALIMERKRRPGEVDRFQWFCPSCDALLHEVKAVVADYRDDPVSQAYRRFFDSEQARTCKACGNVMAAHPQT
jgi:3-hydroxyanthranilate 3,4-dioxygenase